MCGFKSKRLFPHRRSLTSLYCLYSTTRFFDTKGINWTEFYGCPLEEWKTRGCAVETCFRPPVDTWTSKWTDKVSLRLIDDVTCFPLDSVNPQTMFRWAASSWVLVTNLLVDSNFSQSPITWDGNLSLTNRLLLLLHLTSSPWSLADMMSWLKNES